MEGRLRRRSCRRSGEWRPAAAARNRGLGRPGTPPARHDDLAARSSLHGSGGNAGDGSAAPGRKPPRWSAERRASRVMGRAAPRWVRIRSRLTSATTTQVRLSALRPPLQGDGRERKRENPGAARAAGTNNTALFDIVRWSPGCASRVSSMGASCPGRAQRDPGPRGHTSGSLRDSLRLRSRVSFRSRKGARYTRPGHETDARGWSARPEEGAERCSTS